MIFVKGLHSPIPRQGISFAIDSLNLGWETAKTTGLRQEDVFAARFCLSCQKKIDEKEQIFTNPFMLAWISGPVFTSRNEPDPRLIFI